MPEFQSSTGMSERRPQVGGSPWMENQSVLAGASVENALQLQGIYFRASAPGNNRRIFVIEGYPFLEAELIRLLEIEKLHLQEIRKLRHLLDGNSTQ